MKPEMGNDVLERNGGRREQSAAAPLIVGCMARHGQIAHIIITTTTLIIINWITTELNFDLENKYRAVIR